MQRAKDQRFTGALIVLLIVHTAGIIGLHSAYSELFRAATPFNLLLSLFLLLLNHRDFNRAFLAFAFLAAFTGYAVEVAGVNTGMVFGNYVYEGTLGFQCFGTPLIIGINWLMLVYCAGVCMHRLNASLITKSLLGAAVLVLLDLLIEPAAKKLAFWRFVNGPAPLQNYVAWFVIAFALLVLFHSLQFNKNNRLAPALLIVQFLFFTVLYFF